RGHGEQLPHDAGQDTAKREKRQGILLELSVAHGPPEDFVRGRVHDRRILLAWAAGPSADTRSESDGSACRGRPAQPDRLYSLATRVRGHGSVSRGRDWRAGADALARPASQRGGEARGGGSADGVDYRGYFGALRGALFGACACAGDAAGRGWVSLGAGPR